MNERAAKEPSEVLHIYEYHPWHGGINPEWNYNSGLILDVKKGGEQGIHHFTMKLQSMLSSDLEYVICVIPPHQKDAKTSGIKTIARRLCRPPVIEGTDIIARIRDMPKKTDGGVRDINMEFESLQVMDKALIEGKQVLLMDDVTTSGKSLEAGKRILEESGASLVVKLALGVTR